MSLHAVPHVPVSHSQDVWGGALPRQGFKAPSFRRRMMVSESSASNTVPFPCKRRFLGLGFSPGRRKVEEHGYVPPPLYSVPTTDTHGGW